LAPLHDHGSAGKWHRAAIQPQMRRSAIVGAGSWGTALAALWATDRRPISLWGNDSGRIARVQASRENPDYLPGVQLPSNVDATHEFAGSSNADVVVFVTPSVAMRQVASRVRAEGIKERAVLLSCTKGIEHGTGLRMSQILEEIFPSHTIAVLSGPNLAIEVAGGLPTATVIGCRDEGCAADLQAFLGSELFRIYTS